MVVRNKVISVDEKFFYNIFEKERIKLQNKLGVINISQPNFTKMIVSIKIKKIKQDNFSFKIKKGRRKRNVFTKI